jgi:hypothetical protein
MARSHDCGSLAGAHVAGPGSVPGLDSLGLTFGRPQRRGPLTQEKAALSGKCGLRASFMLTPNKARFDRRFRSGSSYPAMFPFSAHRRVPK